MLMRNLAVELGPLGITVNNIAPGAIDTPINAKMMNNKAELAPLLANIPLGRMGTSEEVCYRWQVGATLQAGTRILVRGNESIAGCFQ